MSTFGSLMASSAAYIIRVTTREGKVAYMGARDQTFKHPESALKYNRYGAEAVARRMALKPGANGAKFEAIPLDTRSALSGLSNVYPPLPE